MVSNDAEIVKTIILPSEADKSARREEMTRLSDKRAKLNEEIKEFSHTIRPIEFESYHEFFLIHTFKKGISASGHVDIERLRSRNNGTAYRRSKRHADNGTGIPSTSSSNSTLSDDEDTENDEDGEHNRSPFLDADGDKALDDSKNSSTKRVTRAQLAAKKELEKESESQEKQLEKSDRTLINGDISVASIIKKPEPDGNIRRSSRLSQKTSEGSGLGSAGTTFIDVDTVQIRDLYESLVPKVKEPYRRSDWVLPSRNRYTPEKQMRTKHSHEVVKVNELVGTDRIRSVLSKFEGGVAGVRKRT
ncbi:hypothetical protein HG536_0D01700 [Torulaspora globosa]|uniref:Uncharacterized protein n=1 Tax=Torulaspora globosa TaxID=48254 RepID=A0A7G3ZGL2_9SACH|nr:uncharacterized protein HG536_0D01700 [Torulaspora globosa]QLL32648.1 hypothetical protein HG536_0D01700 [Torulaspora globosa]